MCCACVCVCVVHACVYVCMRKRKRGRDRDKESVSCIFFLKILNFSLFLFSIERKGMELGELGGKEDLKGFRNLEIMIRIYLRKKFLKK